MPLSSYRQFDAALSFAAESVERTMARLLPSGDEGEARVFEAMRYSSLGGGKRSRPHAQRDPDGQASRPNEIRPPVTRRRRRS